MVAPTQGRAGSRGKGLLRMGVDTESCTPQMSRKQLQSDLSNGVRALTKGICMGKWQWFSSGRVPAPGMLCLCTKQRHSIPKERPTLVCKSSAQEAVPRTHCLPHSPSEVARSTKESLRSWPKPDEKTLTPQQGETERHRPIVRRQRHQPKGKSSSRVPAPAPPRQRRVSCTSTLPWRALKMSPRRTCVV